MRKLIVLGIALFGLSTTSYAQVGVGTSTPNAAAALELSSPNQGFLPPRMSTAQRDAIDNPADGLIIFNSTTKTIQ
ncbi:MAG: hypothetical protein EA358_01145, partial [Flavobacteriales bacterium]